MKIKRDLAKKIMKCDTFFWGRKYVYWHHQTYISVLGLVYECIFREPLNSSGTEIVYNSLYDGPL